MHLDCFPVPASLYLYTPIRAMSQMTRFLLIRRSMFLPEDAPNWPLFVAPAEFLTAGQNIFQSLLLRTILHLRSMFLASLEPSAVLQPEACSTGAGSCVPSCSHALDAISAQAKVSSPFHSRALPPPASCSLQGVLTECQV